MILPFPTTQSAIVNCTSAGAELNIPIKSGIRLGKSAKIEPESGGLILSDVYVRWDVRMAKRECSKRSKYPAEICSSAEDRVNKSQTET